METTSQSISTSVRPCDFPPDTGGSATQCVLALPATQRLCKEEAGSEAHTHGLCPLGREVRHDGDEETRKGNEKQGIHTHDSSRGAERLWWEVLAEL